MKNLSKEELLSRLEAINRSNAIIYFDLSGIILGVNDIFLHPGDYTFMLKQSGLLPEQIAESILMAGSSINI